MSNFVTSFGEGIKNRGDWLVPVSPLVYCEKSLLDDFFATLFLLLWLLFAVAVFEAIAAWSAIVVVATRTAVVVTAWSTIVVAVTTLAAWCARSAFFPTFWLFKQCLH